MPWRNIDPFSVVCPLAIDHDARHWVDAWVAESFELTRIPLDTDEACAPSTPVLAIVPFAVNRKETLNAGQG